MYFDSTDAFPNWGRGRIVGGCTCTCCVGLEVLMSVERSNNKCFYIHVMSHFQHRPITLTILNNKGVPYVGSILHPIVQGQEAHVCY